MPMPFSITVKTSQQGDVNWTTNPNAKNVQAASFVVPSNSCLLGWNIQFDGGRLLSLQPVYVSFQQASWDGPSGGQNLVKKLAKVAHAN